MNIAVLIKSVIATDEPIVVRGGIIEDSGVKKIINPYDEFGLEEALRIKEAVGGTVTVISAGTERCVEALRTALAMGADDAVWIHLQDGEADEHTCSMLLASAIKLKSYDLIWAGHLSIDNGAGQVAIRVTELLGWPHAGAVTACRLAKDEEGETDVKDGKGERGGKDGIGGIGGIGENDGIGDKGGKDGIGEKGIRLLVTRDAEGDSESWELSLPALLTAQQGLNEPRYPALAGILKAKRKPLEELSPAMLGAKLEVELRADPEVELGAEAEAELGAEAEAELGAEAEAKHGAEAEAKHGVETEAKHGVETEAKHGVETRMELAGGSAAPRTVRLSCEAPPERAAGRRLGGSPREQAAELLDLLRNEAKVLKEAR